MPISYYQRIHVGSIEPLDFSGLRQCCSLGHSGSSWVNRSGSQSIVGRSRRV